MFAVVKGNVSGMRIRRITLADGRLSVIGGSPVVLLGYPTGVDAILARTGASTLQAIVASSKGDSKQVMEELARHQLIKPVVTQRLVLGALAGALTSVAVFFSMPGPDDTVTAHVFLCIVGGYAGADEISILLRAFGRGK
jgi:hypothetical protein